MKIWLQIQQILFIFMKINNWDCILEYIIIGSNVPLKVFLSQIRQYFGQMLKAIYHFRLKDWLPWFLVCDNKWQLV